MENTSQLDPNVELNFLKRCAVGSFMVGLLFFHRVIEDVVYQWFNDEVWAQGLYALIFVTFFIYMIVAVVKTLNVNVSRQAYWFGNFHDEYLHYVSNQAHKYCLGVLGITLLGAFIGADFITEALPSLDLKDFISLIFSVISFSYSITVWYLLRADND